ncbi:tRNA (adenosine(37)-N6)-dimethylallyltransferase MiaA [Candidatus Saccharibacteria bacterium]|nr:tRNA (adenosine(37)-N6)-dimethylallyltransferase MiaA [Candidatus Saccharibacteria bacterium]
MVADRQRPELLAIVGPTASGKSDLALKLAKEFTGEVITADSRTIYKGMNIGTAKPSASDQGAIKHWGLDLVEPGERFSAYQFQKYAREAIADIQKRGKLPILVGGTGLYVDSTLYRYKFGPDVDSEERKKLENLEVHELQDIISEYGYKMPTNLRNRRHLIRTIETRGHNENTKKIKHLANTLIVGLLPPDEVMIKNISGRVEKMFQDGLVEETKQLIIKYGQHILPSAGIGYVAVSDYINGLAPLEITKNNLIHDNWQYARRQRTWFRRNKFIQWFPDGKQAYEYIKTILNK